MHYSTDNENPISTEGKMPYNTITEAPNDQYKSVVQKATYNRYKPHAGVDIHGNT